MANTVSQNAGWMLLIDTKNSQEEIRNCALRVVKSLHAVFESDELTHRIDLSFSPLEDQHPVIATFSSSLGRGRLRLEWGVHANGLVGIVMVDGERRDKYDVKYFDPVMQVVFPPYDVPYYEVDGERHALKLRSYSGDHRDSILALGMSMLYFSLTGNN